MRASIRHSSLAAIIAATLAAGMVHAQTSDGPLVQLDLPAQSLGETLRAIARLTNLNIVVDAQLVQGREAPAIKTRATAEQVLKLVLEGSGLTPRFVDENTIALQTEAEALNTSTRSFGTEAEDRARPFVIAQADTTANDPPRNDARASAPLNARTTPRPTTSELEEVLVTGTHIRGVTNAASPVVSVTREEFVRWGASTVQEVISKMPQNFGGATIHGTAVAGNKNGNAENSNFGSSISLRGLGNGSTLVLLNGQRVAAAGQGAFVDVSSIPLSALERIDVIADGASAVYGSDAVGGVVNFVLRDHFEGAETNVRYGSVTSGSLHELGVNQLVGTEWGSGAVFVTLDYQDRSHLDASERGFTNALSRGATHLIPEQRLWSALLNGYQELGANLQLSATLYANDRDIDQIVFNPNSLSDVASWVETEQAGGTLSLDWSVTPSWNINLSHTYSAADTTGENLLTSVATGAVQAHTNSFYEVDMSVTELIADGPLFDAPGGQVRLALGGEHRTESLDAVRRGNTQIALSRPLALERDVDALFAEVNVPLVGEQNARAGLHRLDAIAAVRHEDYSDVGSTTNPKFGVVYSPLPGLDFRGTYGTSFRAPHLNQFDDSFGVGLLFRALDTGQIMAAASQIPSPDLGPENATTWTAGFDVHPQSLPGLTINATYFEIEYEDRITMAPFSLAPSSNPLLRANVSSPPDPEIIAAYEFIAARDPAATLVLVPPGTTLADVQATFDGRRRNTAVTNVSGVDLIVSQAFDLGDHRLIAGLNASYMIELENQAVSTSPPVEAVDTLYNPADMRLRASFAWSRGGWNAAAYVNYVDDYSDLQLQQQPRRVASWTTFDVSAGYKASNGLAVQLAATNVFDREPPKVIERVAAYANAGYDSENASPIGRYVALVLSYAW